MNKKWKATHINTCPSCSQLHGQVHSAEEWEAAGLQPRSDKLYCKDACNCTLEDTDEPTTGTIADAPMRRSAPPAGEYARLSANRGSAPVRLEGDMNMMTVAEMKARIKKMMKDPKNAEMMKGKDLDKMSAEEMLAMLKKMTGSSMKMSIPIQIKLTAGGEYEIIAISAGAGNGYQFPPATLKKAVPMWNRIPCYIDHEATPDKKRHSARDLGGIIHSPYWHEAERGIAARLKPTGPSAEDLRKLADAALENPDLPIGFSADIFIDTTDDRTVTAIKRVLSTDAVLKPARGGKFLRVLQSILSKGDTMTKKVTEIEEEDGLPENEAEQAAEYVTEQVDRTAQALQNLLGEQARLAQIEAAEKKDKANRVKLCGYLLDTALDASKLPKAARTVVHKRFVGTEFEATDLEDAIEDQRKVMAELLASQRISGPGRTTGAMFNTDDQLQAAVEDMFGVERSEHLKNAKPARLSGIRELYLMLTGDVELHGGYYGERISLATTADFTGLVKNALNKIVVNSFEKMGRAGYDWYEKIVTVEHFTSLQSITGTLVGTIGSLPTVLEQGEYTELAVGDSPETASFTKYGGYIPLTLEAIDRDETRKLRQYSVELGNAARRNISEQVAAIFTQASGAGPTMADGGALFNSTVIATAGGHLNLLTTALGTDYTAWKAVAKAMYIQPMLVRNDATYRASGKRLAIYPRFCLVPVDLAQQAEALFMPRWEINNSAQVIPTSGGPTWGGKVEPVTVPEWTDATDWAAVADPAIAPSIILGERFGLIPEIYIAGRETDPAVFMNDEHRMKVRQFIALCVGDYRPLHKSNVAG